jgi:hypothetical protein
MQRLEHLWKGKSLELICNWPSIQSSESRNGFDIEKVTPAVGQPNRVGCADKGDLRRAAGSGPNSLAIGTFVLTSW